MNRNLVITKIHNILETRKMHLDKMMKVYMAFFVNLKTKLPFRKRSDINLIENTILH